MTVPDPVRDDQSPIRRLTDSQATPDAPESSMRPRNDNPICGVLEPSVFLLVEFLKEQLQNEHDMLVD